MTTALLLLLSATLVAAGVTLVWRDVRRKSRDPFLVRGDVQALADADVEVTVAHPAAEAAPARTIASAAAGAEHGPEAGEQWAALQPIIAGAVKQVNAVLAGAGVAIGAPSEPSRSLSQGYGAYRRILVGGESLAWLRIELASDGRLHAGVKAHKEGLATINARSSIAAQHLDVARVSDLLSECLKPSASHAIDAVHSSGSVDRWAAEAAWKAIDPIVAAALQAANGALAQAGARFLPLGAPAWIEEARRHRLVVTVEVLHAAVARLHIERIGDEVEVSVGVPDAHLADLGRRQRIAVQGLTTHALAELIAACAWPAIAHFREA